MQRGSVRRTGQAEAVKERNYKQELQSIAAEAKILTADSDQ